jgi:hypothetical protein
MVDWNSYNVCSGCKTGWLESFPNLYFTERRAWFVVRFTVRAWQPMQVDDSVLMATRYEARAFSSSGKDLCEDGRFHRLSEAAAYRVANALKAIYPKDCSKQQELAAYVFCETRDELAEALEGKFPYIRLTAVQDVEEVDLTIESLIDDIHSNENGYRQENESVETSFLTACPHETERQKAFQAWVTAKRGIIKAKQKLKQAETELLNRCDWDRDEEVAQVLASTAELPTAVIAIILGFAFKKSAVHFDGSLHRQLGRKRKLVDYASEDVASPPF